MVQPADNTSDTTPDLEEEDEGYETLVDDGSLVVLKRNGVIAAQTTTPVDLTELGWQLACHGYIIEELIACDGGVIEMRLRPLGVLAGDIAEPDKARSDYIRSHVEESERVYA